MGKDMFSMRHRWKFAISAFSVRRRRRFRSPSACRRSQIVVPLATLRMARGAFLPALLAVACYSLGARAPEPAAAQRGAGKFALVGSVHAASPVPAQTSTTERVAAAPSNPKLVDAYVSAWNSGDVKALIGLLHRDVVVTMPPWQRTFRGSAEFGPFLIGVWPRYFAFRAVATQANGQDAIALFSKAKGGEQTPHSLHVLCGADGEIDEIILYAPPLGGALLASFDLRPTTQ